MSGNLEKLNELLEEIKRVEICIKLNNIELLKLNSIYQKLLLDIEKKDNDK